LCHDNTLRGDEPKISEKFNPMIAKNPYHLQSQNSEAKGENHPSDDEIKTANCGFLAFDF
jgi:hypothetical protein